MSVLQFPSYFNPGQSQEYNIVEECDLVSTGSKKIPSLSSKYTEIKELPFFNKTLFLLHVHLMLNTMGLLTNWP